MRAVIALARCVLILCSLLPAAIEARPREARGWMTTADGVQRLQPMGTIEKTRLKPGEVADIVIDPAQRFQRMAGFGGAITDASAFLIQTKLDAKSRAALMQELFGTKTGVGFSVTRITIGASDFSQTHYSYADTPGRPLAQIAPAREYLIPTLKEMKRVNPDIRIIATPWSAPAWMKTSNSLIKGRLKPDHYGDFARYLVSYVKAMQSAGVGIDMLTLQNEPDFEPENYPGMRVSPLERAAIIRDHLGPMMHREIPDTYLLDWDHNWDQPDSPITVLSDTKAAAYVRGVAWHCYAGDVSAQSMVRDRFPEKESWFTECASGSWSGNWNKSFNWAVKNLVIGTTRHWARGVVMWNLALDEKHGPHLGGCGDCRGLITIDSANGAITREPEYYAFAHASRFVPVGAVRIGSEASRPGLESVAFQQGKSGAVTLILLNGDTADRSVTFAIGQQAFKAQMPSGSVATFVIPGR